MSTETTLVAASAAEQSRSGSEVRVEFTTRDPELLLPEESSTIVVPTNLRRYGLSRLVNHLLATEKSTPFNFLVAGSFLRSSIDDYLTATGLSAEHTLTLEYVRSIIPPLHQASYEHDDWERILSGGYDGLLRVWNTSSQLLTTSPSAAEGGHTSSIKACQFLSPKVIASSGLDRSIRTWKYNESADDMTATLEPQLELYGHRASVENIAVHAPSHRILSGSSDHSVGFWSSKKSDAPPAPSSLTPSNASARSKRRKIASASGTPQRGPLALLQGHVAPVSSTIFDATDATVAYSTSWDHTLRTWDLPTSTLVDTRTTAHPLLCLAALPALHLIAAGTSARHITLIDPRASAATISALTLRGHSNAVVALARNPSSVYGLVSGSHDSTCRVWDVRSTKASEGEVAGVGTVGESMYTIERESLKGRGRRVAGEGVKVFDVAWDRDVGIVSAAEDKSVQINRGRDGADPT
ncbi:MAG: ribosome biogenesis protein ytm1 [Thelocarpon superellum]|nr:MAG: ribosome biogenesis protein ytm1 [Thelocarpon superellum]